MAPEAVRAVVGATVIPNGDLVVPSAVVRSPSLVSGRHVPVNVDGPSRRMNMYGALAELLPDVAQDEIARVREGIWGDPSDRL